MRVAVSYSKFASSRSGGARESLLTLLDGMAGTHEMTVDVFQTPPVDELPSTRYSYKIHIGKPVGVPSLAWTDQVVQRIQWKRYLRRSVPEECDLLFTQNRLAPASVRVASELSIPSIFFVRSLALTGYEKYAPDRGHVGNFLATDLGGRVQYPFLVRNFREYARAANDATHTIANSEFTAGKLDELFGAESRVIYPPIRLDQYRVDHDDDGYITMVNPRAEYKGADVFLDVAQRLPEEEFLLVGPILSGGIEDRAARLPNVTHWEWCDDMRDAYGATKLVLVPSRWEEPFGRVPAEAMVSGIPCVASNRGGLPEVVGETGVVVSDVDSVDAWLDAIQTALETHDPEAQKRRVERFSAERQVAKLLNVIDELGL